MQKRTRSYSDWRQQKLADPIRAVRYLKAAKKQSTDAFLYAVKNVIQANTVAKIARKVGVTREGIYRSFSAGGKPAFHTVDDILKVVGIELDFKVIAGSSASGSPGSSVNRIDQANPVANMSSKGKTVEYSSGAFANLRTAIVAESAEVAMSVPSEGVPTLLPGFLQEQQRLPKFQRMNA